MHPRFGVERVRAVFGNARPEAARPAARRRGDRRPACRVQTHRRTAAARAEPLVPRASSPKAATARCAACSTPWATRSTGWIRMRYGCVVLPRGLKRGVWSTSDRTTLRDPAPRQRRQPRAAQQAARGAPRWPQQQAAQRAAQRAWRPAERSCTPAAAQQIQQQQQRGRAEGEERERSGHDDDDDFDTTRMKIPNPSSRPSTSGFRQNSLSCVAGAASPSAAAACPGGSSQQPGGGGGPGAAAATRRAALVKPDPMQTAGLHRRRCLHRKNRGGRGGGGGRIKPDAVAKNVIGQIYARFEGAGLKIVGGRMATSVAAKPSSSTPCTRSARSSTTWSTS